LRSVGFRHSYLFAFLVALEAAPAFAEFFAGDFAARLDPFVFVVASVPGVSVSNADLVSPKWIAALPAELLPDPKPSTVHTGLTLDLGGITSATGLSHFGLIL
jgi:hypothetical protein